MNKKDLSERDICSKFIGPAVKRAGWDGMMQIREEVAFTKGRIIVRGKLVTRGKAKRADYILYYKPNIPIAIIEAKDNNHSVGDGMQQALDYAATLNIRFLWVRSSCPVTSMAVPKILFSVPFSTIGTPTQRTYRTSPLGRTIRLVTSHPEASAIIRLISERMNSRSCGWMLARYSSKLGPSFAGSRP
jgi:type I site-specific restriction endonuclease